MDEETRLWLISEYTQNTELDFPQEHFGLADKLLLYHVVDELITKFKENGANVRNYAFVNAVRCEMQDRYGYTPKERPKEWV